MDLSHVKRSEPLTNGWVRVWTADRNEGRKNLGYIRRAANGTWEATPIIGAEYSPLGGVLTDREALLYLMGIRFARCATPAIKADFVPLYSS